jgi:two-component system chemotaxis response regulator CheY
MGKKVIVVDDSRTARQQVVLALEHLGYLVIEAVDGVDGAAKIGAHHDAAMVICDVNMPNMSGLEMLADLHAHGRTPDLPVLMLTTEVQPAFVQEAKANGAKGWIVKPFKPELLVMAVKRLTGGPI